MHTVSLLQIRKAVLAFSLFTIIWGINSVVNMIIDRNMKHISELSFESTQDDYASTKQAKTQDAAKPKVIKEENNSFPERLPVFLLSNGQKIRMNSDANCQAVNAYFENRSLSDASLSLTMWTVRNRVGRYYNQSVCDAVLNALYDDKGNAIKDTAHYSWVADGKQHKVIGRTQKDMDRFTASLAIAKSVSKLPSSADPTKGATHYYAVWSLDDSGKRVKTPVPWWVNSKDMKFLFEFEGNRYYRGW